ncbi:MAG: hypothetical protein JSS81_06265 [Acidobacteria bacterium]|nr:hypothetical protein [Acidobacteriota bacterium]
MPENPPDSEKETAETPAEPASGYYYDDACGYEVYDPENDPENDPEDDPELPSETAEPS